MKVQGIGAALAVAVAGVLGVSGVAMAADGGTVTFTGRIVAPALEVSLAAPAANAYEDAARAPASAFTVTLKAPQGVAAGADIALQLPGADATQTDPAALSARFVDGAGHASAATGDGHYRVGRDGGVLSLAAKQGNATPTNQPVMVTISYD